LECLVDKVKLEILVYYDDALVENVQDFGLGLIGFL